MLAPFLFCLTLVGGFAFANEGGDKAIEAKGFKEATKAAIHSSAPVDYSKMND